jgi:hypothetical protein
MTWAKFDDRYDDNRKVKRAWRAAPAAIGIHVMAITHSARHETDGLIDLDWLVEKLPNPKEREKTIRTLIDCGLLDPLDGEQFQVHDFLDFNPSREVNEREREWDRRRKELHRDPELVAAIRERDQDRCRYCGQLVNWRDRRGPTGGTYDHVTPRGPNSLANVVVACRRCNNTKGARTPDQALMPLLDPGQMGARSELGPGQVNGSDLIQGRPSPITRPVPSRPE